VFTAFSLLSWRLDAKSLWEDELGTVLIATQPDLPRFVAAYLTERQPPLDFLLRFGWDKLAGHSDFALRYPSVLYGALAVAAMAAVGRRLGGPRAGLLAAALLCLSPFALLYGRIARYHGLALCLAALALLLLFNAFRRPRLWPVHAALNLALALTSLL